MAYVVTEACIDVLDKSCIEECPVDCIYEGGRMMYINAAECVDCGACEYACPMDAIYHTADLPEKFSAFTVGAQDFFAELGNPGGAAAAGKQSFDAGPAATVKS